MLERNLSIDILKIFLAIIIVALHGKIFIDINEDLYFYLVNGLFRVGVPIFLIITGYYFYYVKNLKSWVKRVLILYLIWSIIYGFIWFEPLTSVKNVLYDLMFLFFGFHHLWYLVGLLFGGILVYLVKDRSFKLQFFLASSLFLMGTTVQYVGNLHVLNGIADKIINIYYFHRNFLTLCFPLLMIGFWINKYNIKDKINNIYILVIVSLVILFLEVYLNYNFISKSESLDQLYSLIIVCPLIFIAFLKINIMGKSKEIALFSTGIYLIHPLIQFIISKYTQVNSIYNFLITLTLSIIISKLIIMLNKKISYIL